MKNQERILSIWAHADDSAWTAGGTIAQLSQTKVIDGLLFTNSNGQGIGDIRLEEERKSMNILGMKSLYPVGNQLGYDDGRLSNEHFNPMLTVLLNIIDEAILLGNPYTSMMTFGKDGYSGHIDHIVVAIVALEAFRLRSGINSIWQVGMREEERILWGEYFVPIPVVDTSNFQKINISSTYKQKMEAIAQHETQMINGGQTQIERIDKMEKVEAFNIIWKE